MTMYSSIFGAIGSSASTTVTNFMSVVSTWSEVWSASEGDVVCVVPAAMTVDQLQVKVNNAPTTGKSYAFTLRQNGADTALTCTISDTATTGFDVTHSVTFAAGDTISLKVVPTGTPTGSGKVYVNMRALAAGQPLLGCITTSPSQSVANFGILTGGSTSGWSGTESANVVVCPSAGVISGLYVVEKVAPASGKSRAYLLRQNAADTTLTCTVANAATAANDTTHSVSVSAGDTLTLEVTPSGTPTNPVAVGWGLLFTPTTNGESWVGYAGGSPSTTVVNYEVPLGNGANFWSTTEQDMMIGNVVTIKKLYVKLGAAPGLAASGKKYDFKLGSSAGGGTFTGVPIVTILETATTGNNATDVSPGVNDLQSIQSVPASTPASASGVHLGILMFATPPVTAAERPQPRGVDRGVTRGVA